MKSFAEQLASVNAYLQTVSPPEPRIGGEDPKFEPRRWANSNKSCFAYAANDRAAFGDCPMPGFHGGHPSPNTDCPVFNQVVRDGFLPAPRREDGKIPPHIDGYYLAAMFLDPENPALYHFYRQDKDHNWSEMVRYSTPTHQDDFGKTIHDPRKAHYYTSNGPDYKFVSFFYVPSPGIELTAAREFVPGPYTYG